MKTMAILAVLAMLALPGVTAQACGDGECGSGETLSSCKQDCEAPCAISGVTTKITNLVLVGAGVLAVLSLILVGVMFMQAGDPQQKERMAGRLKAIIIGLVIIVLAKPVTMFIFNQSFVAATQCV